MSNNAASADACACNPLGSAQLSYHKLRKTKNGPAEIIENIAEGTVSLLA